MLYYIRNYALGSHNRSYHNIVYKDISNYICNYAFLSLPLRIRYKNTGRLEQLSTGLSIASYCTNEDLSFNSLLLHVR
jgi:hypothetical protein